jgi:hypothetical protein
MARKAGAGMSETQRVYVKAWHEPDQEYVRVPPGDLVPVIFDEPSDDELLPRLAWMRREDVLTEAAIRQATADEIADEIEAYARHHSNPGYNSYRKQAYMAAAGVARRVGGGGGGGQ